MKHDLQNLNYRKNSGGAESFANPETSKNEDFFC
jgi:hypothetical protein